MILSNAIGPQMNGFRGRLQQMPTYLAERSVWELSHVAESAIIVWKQMPVMLRKASLPSELPLKVGSY
jgi:hypothetical protein